MSFLDDWKEWSTAKKAISIIIVCCIGILIVAMIGGGLSSDKNTATTSSSDSSSSGSSDTSADDSANKVYKDGTYKVGSDIDAGEYKFTQTSPVAGYVERSSDSSMELDSIISNEATTEEGATVYVTVEDGEYLKISGGELVAA